MPFFTTADNRRSCIGWALELRSNIAPKIQLDRQEKHAQSFTDEEAGEIGRLAAARATVVGIDIYHYSQFPTEKQLFVPHVFEELYNHTWSLLRQNYSFLFQEYGELMHMCSEEHLNYRGHFISTGDGGYQILPTPIHGVVFAMTFSLVLRLYNADRFMRRLFAKVGAIDVRYAMSLDNVYKFRDNYYGSAIITNARILGKDKLNRFLIDDNVFVWFTDRIIGIENLMSLGLNDLKKLIEFETYDVNKITAGNNALIPEYVDRRSTEGFQSVDIQKIGKIKQKNSMIDVHNLHLQAIVRYMGLGQTVDTVTLSVGNLNTVGIENGEA